MEMDADELIKEFEAEQINALLSRSWDHLLEEYWLREDDNDLWDNGYRGEAQRMHQEDFSNNWSGS